MAQAKSKKDAPSKTPLKARLKAWWDGDVASESTVDGVSVVTPPPKTAAPPEDGDGWSEERLAAAGLIFGDGRIDPVGEDFIDAMIRPLGMNDTMSVLEFPAGCGAATRAVARITGAWVTAVEEDAVLATAAETLAKKAGLAKKAVVDNNTLEAAQVRDGSCDVALSFGGLQNHGDRQRVLAAMARALKPSGQLVLTDFALTEAKAGGAEIEAWIAREATARAPDTVADLTALIEGLGLDVRVAEDKGAVYAELARTALRDFMAGAEEREVPPELRAWVMREIEFWARRLAALEAGGLGLYRIHAISNG